MCSHSESSAGKFGSSACIVAVIALHIRMFWIIYDAFSLQYQKWDEGKDIELLKSTNSTKQIAGTTEQNRTQEWLWPRCTRKCARGIEWRCSSATPTCKHSSWYVNCADNTIDNDAIFAIPEEMLGSEPEWSSDDVRRGQNPRAHIQHQKIRSGRFFDKSATLLSKQKIKAMRVLWH